MKPLFEIPEYKKVRVIIDTDAACEADDPYAIVQALLSPKLIVKGIIAEHFRAEGSMEQSYQEIKTILDCMEMDTPYFRGQEGPLSQDDRVSEGVRFLIDEAMREDDKPLYVLCQGAITNMAMALKTEARIRERMTVIWIGTHGDAPKAAPFREFNAGNDVEAANLLLSGGGDIRLVPSTVYSTILIGIAELKRRVRPCGKIGEHLYENLVRYNFSEGAGWTRGENWSLGDSPAAALAVDPECGHYYYAPAPYIAEDTSSEVREGQPQVRIYTDVDPRYILEDMIAKLELFCEAKKEG